MVDFTLYSAVPETPGLALARGEWRLRLLEEVAEITVDMSRALRREVMAEAEMAAKGFSFPDRATPANSAAALAKLSRAERMKLVLHARLEKALLRLREGLDIPDSEGSPPREAPERTAPNPVPATRPADPDAEAPEALADRPCALEKSLQDEAAPESIFDLPPREALERFCHEMLTTPDWSQWACKDLGPTEAFLRVRAPEPVPDG